MGAAEISPIGETIPHIMRIRRPTKRTGVRNLPIISITADSLLVYMRSRMKKTDVDITGGISPIIGRKNISCTVAPVRGIAIKGPIHKIIIDIISSPGIVPIRFVTLDISPLFLMRAKIAIIESPISAI